MKAAFVALAGSALAAAPFSPASVRRYRDGGHYYERLGGSLRRIGIKIPESPADSFDQVPIGARAETVGEEIDERSNLRRKMPRLGIDGAQRHILNDEFVERRRQQALQRRDSQEIPVVRAEPSCGFETPGLAVSRFEPPLPRGGDVAVGQAFVLLQVVGSLGRASGFVVGGAGAHNATDRR